MKSHEILCKKYYQQNVINYVKYIMQYFEMKYIYFSKYVVFTISEMKAILCKKCHRILWKKYDKYYQWNIVNIMQKFALSILIKWGFMQYLPTRSLGACRCPCPCPCPCPPPYYCCRRPRRLLHPPHRRRVLARSIWLQTGAKAGITYSSS